MSAREQTPPTSGRRHKGERGFMSVRPPLPYEAAYKQRAEDLGLDGVGEYVVLCMALLHSQPIPEYIEDQLDQDDLAKLARLLRIAEGGLPLARSA